ncbi:hypothetical protein [Phytohabitans flavus]|uniref:hypothetical protein n=1 Tax=Phytohabitans flavus TaxID=1076124 RepID=UPI001565AE64|nr:hypothetical protein [Phytohabitans flavus]
MAAGRPALSPWPSAAGQATYELACSVRHIHGLPLPAKRARIRPVQKVVTIR